MVELKNTFIQGKLNLDVDERLVPDGQYVNAENIKVSNSEGSEAGALEDMLGNSQLTTLPLGSNPSTIFTVKNSFNNTIYWGVKSDTGSYILEYDVDNDLTTFVLQDERVGNLNVLNFNRDYLITDPRILVDSDNNRTFLLLTDNNSFIKQINIERAKTYGLNNFTEDDISLIKKPPLFSPSITLGNDVSNLSDGLEEVFLIFSYRYIYLDGERSALSPFSEVAFSPETFNYDFATATNESMINNFNQVTLDINTGSSLVRDIEVVFRDSNKNITYIAGLYNKENLSWADNTIESINFSENQTYRVLDSLQTTRLYDNVPLKAKGLELVNNRLVLGNYTDNYNLLDNLGNRVDVDLSLDYTTTPIVSGTPTKSNKVNRDYEAGITYLDDYGRSSTLLTSIDNTTSISNSDVINKNQLRLRISNPPPAWATHYRIYVRQNRRGFDTIVPNVFYEDGLFTWIKLESSERDKISEGQVIYIKSDSSQILPSPVKVKVLEIKEQPRNFLSLTETPNLLQEAGVYFKIRRTDNIRLNEEDFEVYENSYSDGSGNTALLDNQPVIPSPIFYGSGVDDMTSGGTYTGGFNSDLRYYIQIDSLGNPGTATVTLTAGTTGDEVSSVSVDGVTITDSAIPFTTDLTTTATLVADNINNFNSIPNYTATSVGSVITLTSDEIGEGVNGLLVSTTGSISTTTTPFSGAYNNSFRWSEDNGTTFVATDVPITEGVSQTLSNGVEITFVSDLGHVVNDYWVINAKGDFPDDIDKAWGFYTSPPTLIKGGARITLTYDEHRGDGIQFIEEAFTSSRNYANLEEWYWGDDIQSVLTARGIGEERVFFRNGEFIPEPSIGKFQVRVSPDGSGENVMIIRSRGTDNSSFDEDPKVRAILKIVQFDFPIIFETFPELVTSDIYYETPRTYTIVNNYHQGFDVEDTSQSLGTDAIILVDYFNCWSWGNGFESIKIKDLFNANEYSTFTRGITSVEDYRQNNRISSLTYSQPYDQTSNYNGLNEFNLSRINFKDMDDAFGSIQKLWSRDTDLLVFQEDKTHRVLVNKSILYNADGTGNVSQSVEVLGQEVAYAGEYGISLNPESFAIYGNNIWHTDTRRGCVLRLAYNGYFEISENGLKDYFRDYFKNNLDQRKYGAYDPYHDQYVLHLDSNTQDSNVTLTFDEGVKGWTSFHSFLPEGMISLNNKFYTVKDGQLYLHNDESVPRNTYYGVNYPSKISVVVNQNPSDIKVLKSISLEGNLPLNTTVLSYLNDREAFKRTTLTSTQYSQKEGYWYSALYRDELSTNNTPKSVYGLGLVTNINGNEITLSDVNTSLTIGDTLFNATGEAEIGEITNVVGNTLTVTLVGPVALNDFVYGVKNAKIEGSEMRGYTHRIDLEKTGTDRLELYAVNSNVFKSFK